MSGSKKSIRKFLLACSYCGKRSAEQKLKVCSKCQLVGYCSKDCQDNDKHHYLCRPDNCKSQQQNIKHLRDLAIKLFVTSKESILDIANKYVAKRLITNNNLMLILDANDVKTPINQTDKFIAELGKYYLTAKEVTSLDDPERIKIYESYEFDSQAFCFLVKYRNMMVGVPIIKKVREMSLKFVK